MEAAKNKSAWMNIDIFVRVHDLLRLEEIYWPILYPTNFDVCFSSTDNPSDTTIFPLSSHIFLEFAVKIYSLLTPRLDKLIYDSFILLYRIIFLPFFIFLISSGCHFILN